MYGQSCDRSVLHIRTSVTGGSCICFGQKKTAALGTGARARHTQSMMHSHPAPGGVGRSVWPTTVVMARCNGFYTQGKGAKRKDPNGCIHGLNFVDYSGAATRLVFGLASSRAGDHPRRPLPHLGRGREVDTLFWIYEAVLTSVFPW